MTQAVLEIEGLTAGYGELPVVRDLHLKVEQGEVVGLFGPNGAGKTTTLLTVSGILRPLLGNIRVLGRDAKGRAAHQVAKCGCAHVPEDRGLFMSLSVRENMTVTIGKKDIEWVLGYLPALEPLMGRRVGLLSGGEQQMLAMARAIGSRPQLLMIDEMSLGLAPIITQRLTEVVQAVATDTGCAVLLVEQHVRLALSIADRAYVLNGGRIVHEGAASVLKEDRDLLQQAYLGAHLQRTVEEWG